ncbi:hypothetical protein FB45DRAFT_859247 [Roridomyces roridus]|uniref:Uncharacterized protein n=1 Tax=Roridomyces roridus TaxID=1738132 RepID=A0AAD7G2A0_9AGAR|nr:hypothetical protein FB45DRAFT_859247 [Roridomyces roridus]
MQFRAPARDSTAIAETWRHLYTHEYHNKVIQAWLFGNGHSGGRQTWIDITSDYLDLDGADLVHPELQEKVLLRRTDGTPSWVTRDYKKSQQRLSRALVFALYTYQLSPVSGGRMKSSVLRPLTQVANLKPSRRLSAARAHPQNPKAATEKPNMEYALKPPEAENGVSTFEDTTVTLSNVLGRSGTPSDLFFRYHSGQPPSLLGAGPRRACTAVLESALQPKASKHPQCVRARSSSHNNCNLNFILASHWARVDFLASESRNPGKVDIGEHQTGSILARDRLPKHRMDIQLPPKLGQVRVGLLDPNAEPRAAASHMFVQARHSLLFPSKLEIAQQSYRCPPTGNAPTLKAVSCRAFLYSTPVSPVKISVTVRSEMAPSLRQRRGHAFVSPRTTIERLEYLVVGPVFTRDVVGTIHDCIVTVGEQRFLVSAHYDDWAPVNPALKRLLKGYNWRGELVIAALGRRDPLGFVEVTRFNQSEIKRVLNRFLTTALTNIHEGVDIPAAHIITTGFSILYRFGDAKSRCSQWLYRGVLAVKELVAAADSSRRTMETLVLAGKSSWRPNSETSTLNATGVALILQTAHFKFRISWRRIFKFPPTFMFLEAFLPLFNEFRQPSRPESLRKAKMDLEEVVG